MILCCAYITCDTYNYHLLYCLIVLFVFFVFGCQDGAIPQMRAKRMGRLAIYSDDDVIAAGKQLVAAGFDAWRITGTRLRKELGGGTPERLVAAWQSHLRQVAASSIWEDPAIAAVIDGLRSLIGPAKLATMLQQLETTAASVAERAIQAELETARLERREASALLEQMDAQLAEQAQCISSLSRELSEERERLVATHDRLRASHQREVELDSALHEVRAEMTKQLRDASAQRTELLTMLSTISKRAGRHEEALNVACEQMKDGFNLTATAMTAVKSTVTNASATTIQTVEVLNDQIKHQQNQITELADRTHQEISGLAKVLISKGEQGDRLLEQLTSLDGQMAKDRSVRNELMHNVSNTVAQVKILIEEHRASASASALMKASAELTNACHQASRK